MWLWIKAWISSDALKLHQRGSFLCPFELLIARTLRRRIGLAGLLGAWITTTLRPEVLRWILGLSFIGMAAWTLIPDKIEEEEAKVAGKLGVFGATVVTFFFAEMGDKTQLATVAMAAHYATPLTVVMGTTLGMLIADVPAVFVGEKLAARVPMKLVHSIAAAIFLLLGVATLLGAGAGLALVLGVPWFRLVFHFG